MPISLNVLRKIFHSVHGDDRDNEPRSRWRVNFRTFAVTSLIIFKDWFYNDRLEFFASSPLLSCCYWKDSEQKHQQDLESSFPVLIGKAIWSHMNTGSIFTLVTGHLCPCQSPNWFCSLLLFTFIQNVTLTVGTSSFTLNHRCRCLPVWCGW